jgi:hypothetical protein
MAKTWRRLPAKARQQLSDERLISIERFRDTDEGVLRGGGSKKGSRLKIHNVFNPS